MRDLGDRVAVITGGGAGIGGALARACAAAGMDVAVADLDAESAERSAARVRELGRRALAVQTDVSNAASVESLASKVDAELGSCALLVNNAGVLVISRAHEASEADWQRAIGVNLMGAVHGVAAFVPGMLARGGGGHVVNTSSMSGLLGFPSVGVYTATKYAVVGYSESLRAELSPHGIGVTVLCPGGVRTGLVPGTVKARAVDPALLEALYGATREAGDGLMAPEDVAALALDAVRENRPFALTHRRYRILVERRCRELLHAFDAAERRA